MELEEMKAQFELLNKKMEQQTIVTENLLKKGMKRNRSFIKNWLIIHWAAYAIMVLLLWNILCSISTTFAIITAVMVFSEPLLFTLANIRLLSANLYHQPLLEIVKQTAKAKRHYVLVEIVEFAMVTTWLVWFGYNYCPNANLLKFCVGISVIYILVGAFSWHFYKKVMSVYNEIVDNAKELERLDS